MNCVEIRRQTVGTSVHFPCIAFFSPRPVTSDSVLTNIIFPGFVFSHTYSAALDKSYASTSIRYA